MIFEDKKLQLALPGLERPKAKSFKLDEDKFKSHKIGELCELAFLTWCVENDIEVAEPLRTSLPYDFIARFNGEWKTVQVKNVYTDPGKKFARMARLFRGRESARRFNKKGRQIWGGCERKYCAGDFDYLFCTNGEEHWLIPLERLFNSKTGDLLMTVFVDGRFADYSV